MLARENKRFNKLNNKDTFQTSMCIEKGVLKDACDLFEKQNKDAALLKVVGINTVIRASLKHYINCHKNK